MRLQSRLDRLEQQAIPDAPCTCKTLDIEYEGSVEVIYLPACPQHKRPKRQEIKRLANVSIHDL